MTKKGQIWKCEICGNIIEVLHEGADSLVCCGKPMVLQDEKTEDPEKGEKHVPVIEGKKVKIGEIEHPMDKDHYIEWVEASDGKKIAKVFLKPGDKPEAEFDFEVKKAREYCNLHGLWDVNFS
jgi:superoxide reductase